MSRQQGEPSRALRKVFAFVASEQTAGRGRLDRHWVSPKGAGLYCSIILRPQFDQSLWPLLTLMAAVAVHDALLDVYALETDIKWPNDILANDKKLCGILAETVDTPFGRAVILGIGINLKHNSFPAELDKVATSVEAVAGRSGDSQVVLEALVGALARYYRMLQQLEGPGTIVARVVQEVVLRERKTNSHCKRRRDFRRHNAWT